MNPRTPEQQLKHLGLDWERLEKLARAALNAAKRQRRSTLDDGRDRAAVDYLFDVGLVWAYRYDPAKSNGVSFATSVYRRMVIRYPDFLRYGEGAGDPRLGTPLTLVFTGEMPDGETMDEETFEQALENVSAKLSSRSLWTLHHLARPMAENETPMVRAAKDAKVPLPIAFQLLEQLRCELDPTYVPEPVYLEAITA